MGATNLKKPPPPFSERGLQGLGGPGIFLTFIEAHSKQRSVGFKILINFYVFWRLSPHPCT